MPETNQYRTFKWTVEIEVDEREVADGFNPGKPFSLHQALQRGYPYLNGGRIAVEVLSSPPEQEIRDARGAGEIEAQERQERRAQTT